MQLATRFARNANRIEARDGYLSDDALRTVAPSIFATAPHESRSARYQYIPTGDIVRGLVREGFFPVMACQSRCRVEGKSDFTKHMLRFRREGDNARVQALITRQNHNVDHSKPLAEFPEIVLVNSHDGTSSYQLMGGFFRLICCNGLIVGDAISEVRVHHKGDILGDVVNGAHALLEALPRAAESMDRMKALPLTPAEARILAEGAIEMRFEPAEGEAAPLTPEKILMPRRAADSGADLWSTFNRIQENVIRGGLHGQTRNAAGHIRHARTREVKGIDQSVRLNRALWTLAEKMAALKS